MILPLAYITAAWGSGVDFDEKCDTYSRALLEAGYYPICPKAHQSIFLHEDNPREHQLGLDMSQHILGRCRLLVVCGSTYDEYVKSDIAYAESHHIPTTTLTEIITSEKLKPEETRKFVANAFRDGALKTTGTEIDKLMPPVSRFGGGGRAKKKQGVIEKLKAFFEKYFGLGITEFRAEEQEQSVVYEIEPTYQMVAEEPAPYGTNPFAYIHSEKDILKLVTALIANTKGEGKAGDDFWVKAETLLYTALYIIFSLLTALICMRISMIMFVPFFRLYVLTLAQSFSVMSIGFLGVSMSRKVSIGLVALIAFVGIQILLGREIASLNWIYVLSGRLPENGVIIDICIRSLLIGFFCWITGQFWVHP